MAPTTASKLILLEDQTQISIEERNRLLMLNLAPSENDDKEIEHSLKTILQGIKALEQDLFRKKDQDSSGSTVIERLVNSYNKLLDLYAKDPNVTIDHLTHHWSQVKDEESLVESSRLNKSVRFKDNLEEHGPQLETTTESNKKLRQFGGGRKNKDKDGAAEDLEFEQARQELFLKPYRDEPDEVPEDMDNDQMYQQQQQSMRDQDAHLDRLASSVSRQHELSIQIDDELGQHLDLLDEVDGFTDRSQNRLEAAKKRLDVFSKKAKENGSILTIAILMLIFIILVAVLK